MLSTYLNELPKLLIARRKSLGWTQKKLAEKLGIKEQQIQKYEALNYQSASLRRLIEVAKALEIEDVSLR